MNGPLDKKRGGFGLAVVVISTLVAGAPMLVAQTWTQLTPSGGPPTVRQFGATVVGDGNGNLIVFGGAYSGCGGRCNLNDTWVLANANGLNGTPTWTQLSPAAPPQARDNHSGVYDPNTNRLIIFGGCEGGCLPVANDTWVLTNANGTTTPADPQGYTTPTWIQLSPSGGPPGARQSAAAAYDPSTNRMIVFGGQNGGGSGGIFTDTWVLTNANGTTTPADPKGYTTPTWIPLSSISSTTPPTFNQQMASFYDSASNRFIVAGGSNGSAQTNAVWALTYANFNGGTPAWVNLIAAGAADAPVNFAGAPGVYDPANNRGMILIPNQNSNEEELWVLSNANGANDTAGWLLLSVDGSLPAASYSQGEVFDAQNDVLTAYMTVTENSVTSNQVWVTANGDGAATQTILSGNGSLLTNLNPANLGPGTAGINITGNAATATTATTALALNCTGCVGNTQLGISYAAGDAQGGNALNALMLGGSPAAAFAPASGDSNYAPASGSPAYVSKAGDTMTGTLTATGFNAPQFTSGAGGQSLSLTSVQGPGSGGSVTISAADAGGANGGSGGNVTLQAGSATPVGGSGYTNQGKAGTVNITAGGGYNGVGGSVTIKSGPNSNWSQTANGFSVVSLQGGALLGNDGAVLSVEGAHNGSSSNAALSYGGNMSLTAGTGYGGLAGGNITLTPGTGTPNGSVNVAGNLSASGSVAAAAFKGNGSALTNVQASTLAAGATVSGSQVTGAVANATNAATATKADSATSATNAAELGGVGAADYARLDTGNKLTGNQSVIGNLAIAGGKLTIGAGGTPISQHLSVLVNPDFPALKPASCASRSATLAGAADGDTVALGLPATRMSGGGSLIYMAWVSGANTVTIQACNVNPATAQKTAGTGAIRVDLWKH
jgi:hypothetical protein